jgi:ferrous iron transport protein B
MHSHSAGTTEIDSERAFVLVGNPNVGKSVFFNQITGRYVTVANYPGTTVEIATGKTDLGGTPYTIIDTPGVNSLVPMSEDEAVTRDILLSQPHAAVLQVADSKNTRRALIVSAQLADLGVPFALALNMSDEADSRGVFVDAEALQSALGVPVTRSVAVRNDGVDSAVNAALKAEQSSFRTILPDEIEIAAGSIAAALPDDLPRDGRGLAISWLSGDDDWIRVNIEPDAIAEIERIRHETENQSTERISSRINQARLDQIDRLMDDVSYSNAQETTSWATHLASWSTDPVKGLVVLGLALLATFWFVGLLGAGTAVDTLETLIFGRYLSPAAVTVVDWIFQFPHTHLLEDNEWVLSLPLTPAHEIPITESVKDVLGADYQIPAGVALSWFQIALKFVHDVLVGPYGQFTMALSYGFAIVLPIVGFFFIVFSILEDSGYLPRLAVMSNRIFRVMGLNGKAILPMMLGLGCDTMATMTSRILATTKERVIVTLLLALGVPCSAQLGVILGMVAGTGLAGAVWWIGTVAVVMLLVGWLASKVLPGEESDLILELPALRQPQMGNIVIKTVARVEWYLKEVVPLFMLGTAVLFVLDLVGALSVIERMASPLVQGWLGLPAKATEAFLIGFLRRDYGAAGLLVLHMDGLLDPIQTVVSLVTITLFVPCIANVFIIAKERNVGTAIWMTAFIFPFAFLVGGLVRHAMLFVGGI